MPYNETVSCNEKYLISSEADIRNPSDKRKPMVAIKATTGFFQLFFSRFPVFFLLFFLLLFLQRSFHETTEQRMRSVWTGFQLRMSLCGNEERMILQLNHLDDATVRGKA